MTELNFCDCPDRVFTMKDFADSVEISCANCEQVFGTVSKREAYFFDYIYNHTKNEIKKKFTGLLLKRALSIKTEQEEMLYKRKLQGLD